MILGVCYVAKSVLVTENMIGADRALMFQMYNLRHKTKHQRRNWSFQSYEFFFVGLFEKAEKMGRRNGEKEEGGSESRGVSRSYSLPVTHTIST